MSAPTSFSVIRYTPDNVACEYINIGIAAQSKGPVVIRMSNDLLRARAFDHSGLLDSALQFIADLPLTGRSLEDMHETIGGIVSFTLPMPSLATSPDDAIDSLWPHFIKS
jgi:hypothetical protein